MKISPHQRTRKNREALAEVVVVVAGRHGPPCTLYVEYGVWAVDLDMIIRIMGGDVAKLRSLARQMMDRTFGHALDRSLARHTDSKGYSRSVIPKHSTSIGHTVLP
eukprot:COSAG05_NODE_20_length_33177_cov_336.302639_20_plen_106_part_00